MRYTDRRIHASQFERNVAGCFRTMRGFLPGRFSGVS
jgi:hypothetical protein